MRRPGGRSAAAAARRAPPRGDAISESPGVSEFSRPSCRGRSRFRLFLESGRKSKEDMNEQITWYKGSSCTLLPVKPTVDELLGGNWGFAKPKFPLFLTLFCS
jgi:hypothetical protein